MSDPDALRRKLAGARGAVLRGRVPARTEAGRADRLVLEAELHGRLLDQVDGLDAPGQIDSAVRDFVGRVLEEESLPLNETERSALAATLSDETLGVGPIAPLLADPAVTDVLVNAPDSVWIERGGVLEKSTVRFRDVDHVLRVIARVAARVGRRIDAGSPMVDLRLPDGSRVNATIPPASPDGPTLSIRRFGRHRLRSRDLLRIGTLSEPMWRFLALAVRYRRNVLISGGTGAGKSTLLGVLTEAIPPTERVVTIEDTLELQLEQEHVVRLEARPANVEERGAITARDLVRNALRMRPDRIVVGEVRGGEALDMLQAMNTGHEGSLSTIHANAPRDALARLETMVLMAGLDLPARAIRDQIVSAIEILVQVRRFEDGVRRVESIVEIAGQEGDKPLLQDLFRFERLGVQRGRVQGAFRACGVVPRLAAALRERGADLPVAWFQRTAEGDVHA
jgi:pilus assembly protein CpaF